MVDFNRILRNIWEHRYSQNIKNYIKNWYQNNKKLFWVVLAIIILGIVPIFPLSSTEQVRLDVPYHEGERGRFNEQGIEIRNNCDGLDFWIDLSELDTIPIREVQSVYSGFGDPKKVTPTFGDYNISIFAIKTCDECIDEKTLSVTETKECLMDYSSVFGYFEKCWADEDAYYGRVCEKSPFVISNNVQVISPDKNFKIEILPYVIKTKIKGDNNNIIIKRYYVELIITYPDWKPLPYAKWIGTALLFILDPLKAILRYFMDRWFY